MPCILHIETATEVCSVAVSKDDSIIFSQEEVNGPSHASLLGVFVNNAIAELRKQNIQLDAVAVSCGPGSYTGLRIGVSEAKGLCFGLNIPLIAIETLRIMAHGIASKVEDANTLLCPMIDARRMEVYDAIYACDMKQVRQVSADIIDQSSFGELLKDNKIAFFGNGAPKCKEVLGHNANAMFIDNIYPRASDMMILAQEAFDQSRFEDVAYFEPFYLKEFVATTPKNKVLAAIRQNANNNQS